jgi:phosphatidylserine/phosphatidylglycerophosphate/cardiolipin synthase-like enzyme
MAVMRRIGAAGREIQDSLSRLRPRSDVGRRADVLHRGCVHMRKVSWLLAVALIMGFVAAPPAAAYEPPGGASFNVPRPWGTDAQIYRIIRTIETAINRAQGPTKRYPSPEILVSTFLLDRSQSVDALIAACRRGISVRVILDEDIDNRNSRRLIQKLNGDNVPDADKDGKPDSKPKTGRCGRQLRSNRSLSTDQSRLITTRQARLSVRVPTSDPLTWGRDHSYVKRCSGSCRGGAGNVHSKFYLISRTGSSKNVVMVSSANLNAGGALLGWNDLVVMKSRPKSFKFYANIHRLMTAERRAGTKRVQVRDGRYISRFFPMRNATKADDPTLKDLKAIRCNGSPLGRTRINVSMFYWKGKRGDYLLDALLDKARAGCRVAVIYGAPSVAIAERLRSAARAGLITLYDSRWDFDEDGWNEVRTHAKYVLVKGWYGRDSRSYQVWTGSQNWVGGSLTLSDETTLNISSRRIYDDYLADWANIRDHSRRLPYH